MVNNNSEDLIAFFYPVVDEGIDQSIFSRGSEVMSNGLKLVKNSGRSFE
jgi:hypothetical protein